MVVVELESGLRLCLEKHCRSLSKVPSDRSVEDADYLPGAEDWAVVESLRSSSDNANERDPEDERFIALMLGGDAFD